MQGTIWSGWLGSYSSSEIQSVNSIAPNRVGRDSLVSYLEHSLRGVTYLLRSSRCIRQHQPTGLRWFNVISRTLVGEGSCPSAEMQSVYSTVPNRLRNFILILVEKRGILVKMVSFRVVCFFYLMTYQT